MRFSEKLLCISVTPPANDYDYVKAAFKRAVVAGYMYRGVSVF